ncbi:MAG: hypothetical protein NTW48_08405 [Chloroflexi bacterium]|nr:hypothetical protein [Chloroflexota bacterium]
MCDIIAISSIYGYRIKMTIYTSWDDIGLAIAECCKTLLCECCCGTPPTDACWTYTSDFLSSYTDIKKLWPMGNAPPPPNADWSVGGGYPEANYPTWVRLAGVNDFNGTNYSIPSVSAGDSVWIIEDHYPIDLPQEKDWGLKLHPHAAPNANIVDCTMIWHNVGHTARGKIIAPNGRYFSPQGLPVPTMLGMPQFTATLIDSGVVDRNDVKIWKLCSAPAAAWPVNDPATWGNGP